MLGLADSIWRAGRIVGFLTKAGTTPRVWANGPIALSNQRETEPDVTVCIAALCDRGKACVVAADKMLVSGGGNFEFKIDGRLEKIRRLSSDSVLMHSGVDADAVEIVEATAPLIAERPSKRSCTIVTET